MSEPSTWPSIEILMQSCFLSVLMTNPVTYDKCCHCLITYESHMLQNWLGNLRVHKELDQALIQGPNFLSVLSSDDFILQKCLL